MTQWQPKHAPFTSYKKDIFKKAGLVSSFIYQIGEYTPLRKPSKDVLLNKINSKDMRAKLAYIKKCLITYRKLTGHGRGITAVQVGIPEKFAVIHTPEKLMIIINPHVTKKSAKLLKYFEMCMSAVPIIAPIIRPAWIEFEYYNEEGNKMIWNTKDDTDEGRMMNRVFQHEIDHMKGIINIDIVAHSSELILESDPKFYENATFEEQHFSK